MQRISIKGLLFKIHKELLQLNRKPNSSTTKKWAEDVNRHFLFQRRHRWLTGTGKDTQYLESSDTVYHNHSEISSTHVRVAILKKTNDKARMWRKANPGAPLTGV